MERGTVKRFTTRMIQGFFGIIETQRQLCPDPSKLYMWTWFLDIVPNTFRNRSDGFLMNFWWVLCENQQSLQSIDCMACQFCTNLSLVQNQAHPNEGKS